MTANNIENPTKILKLTILKRYFIAISKLNLAVIPQSTDANNGFIKASLKFILILAADSIAPIDHKQIIPCEITVDIAAPIIFICGMGISIKLPTSLTAPPIKLIIIGRCDFSIV